ncbi:acyl-CoA dehydrogenase [Mycobacterium sp. UM_Kg1]|uniref:acyl-CoA dehydrogenase n=1 Tax=Mycobacterium sp. UM_Kg1 TaxID=1545691 RepID=UPI00061AF424|nr:acyl-CoA dehydrogenase [Mycobacterium sp. UM_Kg1]
MSVTLSAEQRQLGDSLRQFAARHAPMADTRKALDALASGELPSWWNDLVANGFHAVHIPEQYGGQGGGLHDAAAVLEAAGAVSLPGPLLPTVTAGAVALLGADTPAQERFLRSLTAGTPATVVLAGHSDFTAARTGDGWRISGVSEVIPGARSAGLLLVCARCDDGTDLWTVVDAFGAPVEIRSVAGTDLLTDLATITLVDCPARAGDFLAGVDTERADYVAVGLAAAVCAGIAGWCVGAATSHLRTREQFGVPIGTFQALQHQAAMLLVNTELACAAAWDALRAVTDTVEQHRMAAATAALTAVVPCPDTVFDTLTMFGAIGFTWEHDLHLYWRRATSIAASIGAATDWARRLGELAVGQQRDFAVDLGGAEAEFRAGVAATLDAAAALANDGPGRQGDYPHFETGPQRTLIAEAGLVAPQWPAPWGLAASPLQQLIIIEEFAKRPGLVRPSLGIAEWILPSLIHAASEPVAQRLIPATQRGELAWCQLFSEPGAGSDLASLITRATKVDGGWLVNGHKIWTSAAQRADYGALLARTDPAAPKHRGIGYFVVDMRSPGIEVQPIQMATGVAEFNEVFLTDVFVPDEMLLGGPTEGWQLAITTMAQERTAISAYVENDRAVALRAIAAAAGRSRDDAVRALGELDAYANAIRALGVRETIRMLDGTGLAASSSIAKVAMNVLLRRTFRATLATVGRLAMVVDSDPAVVEPYLLSPAELIGGGTKEIQLNIIAQMILGLPRR